jgi:hypothetical protein
MAAPVMALIALAQSGYQMYKSHQQKKKAEEMKDSRYVPPSVQQALASANSEATQLSPGYSRSVEKIRQSSATSINNAKRIGGSSNQIQNMVNNVDAREKEAIKDVEVSENAFKARARDNVRGLMMTKGGFEKDSRDAYNAAKSALIGASEQNKYNAITNLGEGIVNSLPDNMISPESKNAAINGANPAFASPNISKRGTTLIDPSKGPLTQEQLKYLMGIRPKRQFYAGY